MTPTKRKGAVISPENNKRCIVDGCRRKEGEGATAFFFPIPVPKVNGKMKDLIEIVKKRREIWLKKINHVNSGDQTDMWICNHHFFTGRPSEILDYDHPDWAPTLNLNGITSLTPAKREELNEKLQQHRLRKKLEKESQNKQSKKSEKRNRNIQYDKRKKTKIENSKITDKPSGSDQESTNSKTSGDDSKHTDEENNPHSSDISSKGSEHSENEEDEVSSHSEPSNKNGQGLREEVDMSSEESAQESSKEQPDKPSREKSREKSPGPRTTKESLPHHQDSLEEINMSSEESEDGSEEESEPKKSFSHEPESDEDFDNFSLDELREQLKLAREKIRDLTIELAQKQEEVRRLQSKQPSQKVPSLENDQANQKPHWKILENVGKKDKPFLLDGLGHKLGIVSKTTAGVVLWRCTIRTSYNYCYGAVRQKGDEFTVITEHTSCTPVPNLEAVLLLNSKAKQIASKGDSFESAYKLVEPLLAEPLRENPTVQLPNLSAVARTLNRMRRKLRPSNPEELFFQIVEANIPKDFLREDVVVVHSDTHRERHLVFGTDRQTKFLKEAKCWYVDRTCRLIKKPFIELLSIHGLYSVESEKDLKDVPLLYVFMSSRTTKDYTVVFEKILEMLDQEQRVKEIVFNFHESILQSLKEVLPSVSLYGCPFQWSQTVLRKFKELGLISLYEHSESVHKLLSRVLSLHLLPSEKIPQVFQTLKTKAGNLKLSKQKSIMQFFEYVEKTWIENSVWTPENWSVFMLPIKRTNADGWHKRIVSMTLVSKVDLLTLDFYNLVPRLYNEVLTIFPKGEVHFIGQRQQALILRKQTYKSLSFSLYKYWDSFKDGQLKALHLLKSCAEVYMEHCDFKFVYDEGDKRIRELEIDEQ